MKSQHAFTAHVQCHAPLVCLYKVAVLPHGEVNIALAHRRRHRRRRYSDMSRFLLAEKENGRRQFLPPGAARSALLEGYLRLGIWLVKASPSAGISRRTNLSSARMSVVGTRRPPSCSAGPHALWRALSTGGSREGRLDLLLLLGRYRCRLTRRAGKLKNSGAKTDRRAGEAPSPKIQQHGGGILDPHATVLDIRLAGRRMAGIVDQALRESTPDRRDLLVDG